MTVFLYLEYTKGGRGKRGLEFLGSNFGISGLKLWNFRLLTLEFPVVKLWILTNDHKGDAVEIMAFAELFKKKIKGRKKIRSYVFQR